MCVFWRSLCSKFLDWETILRDCCVDWIIGWVVCWVAFISGFFSSWKTVLKSWLNTSLTPPRYLAICWASQAFFLMQSRHLLNTWWIDRESSYLLDSSLTPDGLIELLFLNLIFCCSMLGHMCFSCYRTYVMILCNWLIFWQNALYLYLGRLRMCLSISRNHVSRSSIEAFKSVQEIKQGVINH